MPSDEQCHLEKFRPDLSKCFPLTASQWLPKSEKARVGLAMLIAIETN